MISRLIRRLIRSTVGDSVDRGVILVHVKEVTDMLKTTFTGIPIHITADRIVVQDGAAVDTYSRQYYRLAHEPERRIDWTPPEMKVVIGREGHGILVPVGRR